MSTFSRLVVYVMAAIPVISVHAETINDYALWNIKSDPRETRWIQIREFQRMEGEEIFHIDVYSRENGDMQELAMRLADHIAIEREALLNSIGQPVDTGVPERVAYDKAVTRWMKTPAAQREICRRPVQRCLDPVFSE
ncbi:MULTISPECIES: DUF5086 family protein [Thalassolituus]|uniref:DUF5086 family protein n=2 Tax=Oceanospirillaceae TaxID=135620 RepID=UPI0007D0169C|nr:MULTISPECIES: DUF5086 family protein [Thalassolituus]KZZ05719.1 hypothetical protein A3746_03430 [Oleibacter sp. HI0075]MAG43434.1 hypothetical protein [Oceanospirillaceae bacterium]MAX85856.1 hypothetical protein [Oceanospirillaceae bacterium]